MITNIKPIKEKKVVRNIRLSFSGDLDRKLAEVNGDRMWNMLPLNAFIRHCVEVGLKEIAFDMELRRAETKVRLHAAAVGEHDERVIAAAAKEYVKLKSQDEKTIDFWEYRLQPADTGVKATVIPFGKAEAAGGPDLNTRR